MIDYPAAKTLPDYLTVLDTVEHPFRKQAAHLMAFQYDFTLLPDYLAALYSKMRIAVIYGGDKNKDGAVINKTINPRSWKSYEHVARDIQTALQEIGFQYVTLMPDDMTLPQRLKEEGIHLAWLNTGGVQGYSPMSHAPAMLELLGIPYVGHDPIYASMLDHKPSFKRQLQVLGIRTAPFITWHPSQGPLTPVTSPRFLASFGEYDGPFVIKPVSGRASLHVEVVESIHELPQTAEEIYALTNNTVLIETFLPGREFCVSVCGGVIHANGAFSKTTMPFAFSMVERILEANEAIFTSMDKKAITLDRVRVIGDSERELKHELRQLAETIYWELNLHSLIRIDVRADKSGDLYVLEANPKPDLKKAEQGVTSLTLIGLSEHRMTYNDLILGLLADRLDHLFMYNINTIQSIVKLLA